MFCRMNFKIYAVATASIKATNLVDSAEKAINSRPKTLILSLDDCFFDGHANGPLMYNLRNLIDDDLNIVFLGENLHYFESIKNDLLVMGVDESKFERQLVITPKAALNRTILHTPVVNLSKQRIVNRAGYFDLPINNLWHDQNLELDDDYDITHLLGFLNWLHLRNEYCLETFNYALARDFFDAGYSLKHYNQHFKSWGKLDSVTRRQRINQIFIQIEHKMMQHRSADLHIHPTSSVSANFILSRMRSSNIDIDWKDLDGNTLIANRLLALGFVCMNDLAKRGTVDDVKRLISEPLEGKGYLNEYLLRYQIIKKVLQTTDDLVEITHALSKEAYQSRVHYVELRFGLLITPQHALSDEKIVAFNQRKMSAEKEAQLIEFLKFTHCFNSYLAYATGMSDFAKSYPDFDYRFLAIVDKGISPVLFEFLAQQMIDFVGGEGIYKDARVVDTFKKIVDTRTQAFANLSDKDWRYLIKRMKKSLVGFDTAGSEYRKDKAGQVTWKYDPRVHRDIFEKLHSSGRFKTFTSHAGESFASLEDGLSSIEEAIDYLGVQRIGHGLALGINPKVLLYRKDEYGLIYDSGRIQNLIDRQEALIEKVKAKAIAIEVNFSCNIHTGNIRNPFKHPTYRMYQKGLKLILGTDGTSMNNTTIAQEMAWMQFSLNLLDEMIYQMLEDAKAYQFDI